MNLTEHFRMAEFLPDAHAGDVPPDVEGSLTVLCVRLLEPARVALGFPFRITSGWRPSAYNARIGGAKNSDHVFGRAADVQGMDGPDMDPERTIAIFDWLRENGGLHLGQLILEDHRISSGNPGKLWVHVASASKRHPGHSDPARILVSPAAGVYEKWVAADV